MRTKRGFTLIELLTVMAIIALLVGLLLPALAQARAKAQMTKDQTQIKQIHAAWTTFSRDYNGIFPTPGIINRLPVDAPGTLLDGEDKPGRGAEDIEANTSAAMYSACIMQNYFTPQILVAPTEPSGFVTVKDDFDWSLYSPLEDFYWDADEDGGGSPDANTGYIPFSTRLNSDHPTELRVCNSSYAHTPICGARKVNEWRDSLNSKWAACANRGVTCGNDTDIDVYDASVTLEFHGGRKQWVGNVGYNDNHVELHDTFYPEGVTYLDSDINKSVPDNLFANETSSGGGGFDSCNEGDGFDVWLTLISDISDGDSCSLTSEWD
ncbi:MAG: type II secretion system protein [Planctomycetota bacterium]|jgi:prepilin-type N-terminal cleavage/methylation domain-containing protein